MAKKPRFVLHTKCAFLQNVIILKLFVCLFVCLFVVGKETLEYNILYIIFYTHGMQRGYSPPPQLLAPPPVKTNMDKDTLRDFLQEYFSEDFI